MLLPHLLEHEQWRSNPLTELGLISYLGVPISWPDGQIFGTICVRDSKRNEHSELYLKLLLHFRDVLQADLKSLTRLEGELEEREIKIRRLFDANIIGIFIWDLGGQVSEANDAFLQMVGYDREDVLSGRIRVPNLTPPEWDEVTARALDELKRTGTFQPYEKEYHRRDGSRVPVLLGGAAFGREPAQAIAFVIDLTERKRAEILTAQVFETAPDGICIVERDYRYQRANPVYCRRWVARRAGRTRHANRVATMGQLTASIAHEVSQPIAAMLTNAQAALRWLTRPAPDLGEVREALASIVTDAMRAGDVVSRIRDLMKKTPPRKDLLDVNRVVREVIELTHGEAVKNGVSLLTELADSMPLIPGDRIQLQQSAFSYAQRWGPVGNRCPLSRDLNVVERVSITDCPVPRVVNFPTSKPEDRCHHSDHSERAPNGHYA